MAKSRNILMGAGAGIVFATIVAMFLSGRSDLPEGLIEGQADAAAPANVDAAPTGGAEAPAAAAGTDTQDNTQAAEATPAPEAEVTGAEPEAVETAEAAPADPVDTTPADGTDATILFDLVRVEPNGATLVAGSAPAGAGLAILVDGVRVATADAGNDGKFASFLDLPPAPRARVLTLAKLDGQQMGAQGNQRVILAPVIAEPEVAETAPEATTDAPEQPTTADAGTAPEAPADSAPLPIASDAPGAPTVLLADDKGMRVLQPGGSAPEVMEQVALDVISYDAEGEVNLAGRGTGEGHVRVYVDNEPVITTAIDQNGGWQVQLPQINSGDYTLRVDEIAVDGSVASRLETPFRRESAEVLADAPRDETGAVTATVTPGSTLWAIAEGKYGDGLLYVRVFEANRDKIRNPDLIYPGQIFDLPNE